MSDDLKIRSAIEHFEARQPVVDITWEPLYKVLKREDCNGFMFMGTATTPTGETVYLYKHGITRRFLNLTMDGKAWRYTNPRPFPAEGVYVPCPVSEALHHCVGELVQFGATLKTPYDEAYIARRTAALRAAGYEVITARGVREDAR